MLHSGFDGNFPCPFRWCSIRSSSYFRIMLHSCVRFLHRCLLCLGYCSSDNSGRFDVFVPCLCCGFVPCFHGCNIGSTDSVCVDIYMFKPTYCKLGEQAVSTLALLLAPCIGPCAVADSFCFITCYTLCCTLRECTLCVSVLSFRCRLCLAIAA